MIGSYYILIASSLFEQSIMIFISPHSKKLSFQKQIPRTNARIQPGEPFNTVDGRNPAPVDMANIPSFPGFHRCWVVQDFFHQQYYHFGITSGKILHCNTGTGD